MKFNEYVEHQHESFLKMFEWMESWDFESEEDVNEAANVSFPIVKFIRIKSNVKKLSKAEIAVATEEIAYQKMKHSEKWPTQDPKRKEIIKKAHEAKKTALQDQIGIIKQKLDALAGSNKFLLRLVTFGKLKAKKTANDKIIKQADKVMSDSMRKDYQESKEKNDVKLQDAYRELQTMKDELKAAQAKAEDHKKDKEGEEKPEDKKEEKPEDKEDDKKEEKPEDKEDDKKEDTPEDSANDDAIKKLEVKLQNAESDEEKERIRAEIEKLKSQEEE